MRVIKEKIAQAIVQEHQIIQKKPNLVQAPVLPVTEDKVIVAELLNGVVHLLDQLGFLISVEMGLVLEIEVEELQEL